MFSPETSKGSTPSLIPDKTLHFASVNVQGLGTSQRSGGSYAKLELVLINGPYQGRKIYTIIMNPQDDKNVNHERREQNKLNGTNLQDGASMGLTALTRAFEAAGHFDPSRESSYRCFDGMSFDQIIGHLSGKTVAIKIKLTPAKDGYDEKNEVAEWLSPYGTTASSYRKLTEQSKVASQPAIAGGFLQAPKATPAQAAPAWVDTRPKTGGPFG